MIANNIDTLIASSYTDGLTVNFASKDWRLWQEQADNINFIAEFDNNEDDYQQLYYQKEQDRYFFGVSIRYRYWRDDVRKIPLFTSVNPLCWIPDPSPSQTGRFDGKNYRFHWFEMSSTIMDLASDKTYDQEALDKVVANFFSTENVLNRNTYATAYNYNYPTTVGWLKDNFAMDIYYHMTSFTDEEGNTKKYISTTTAEKTNILRLIELKPVLVEEKKDDNLICYPVVLNYRKPRRNDPFGESVCDKLDDKQIAKTILFNLNIIKAKKEALGGDMIWNSRLIKNRNDILKPTVNWRNVFVDTNEPLGNVGIEIPRSQIKADSMNMMWAIDNEVRYDVSLDNQQSGVISDRDVTATESQIAQANSNIIGLLNNKINSRWDKHFRFERWKGYQENFASADKKLVSINANFEYKSMSLAKDDFLSSQIPFITVGTRSDVDWQKQKDILFWDKTLPLFMQDPTVPEVSKDIARRMWLRANGKTPNEINVLVPLKQFERKALTYLNMVNLEIMPESMMDNPPEAYPTFRVYLQKADNNKMKDKVLAALSSALESMPSWQQPMPWQGWEKFNEIANSNSNVTMSQAIQAKPEQPNRQNLATDI